MLLHLNGMSVAKASPIFEAMEKARLAGKIRPYGWSTDFPASAAAMTAMPGFVAVEHAMNVLVDAPSMQATVAGHGLVALIRSPLAMGVLTGKYDESLAVSKDDVRSVNSERRDYFRDGKAVPHHLATLRAVRDLLQTGGRSLAQGALGWLMAKSDRNLPLPGARSVAQVIENAGALALGPLPDDVMRDIETTILREPESEPRAR
jgi:aryl-alcohol dehydrogenase-like predicted oxidoreductase